MAKTKSRSLRHNIRGLKDGELRFIPLGGLGEIGKNMMAIEYGSDIIVIDCGLMFPEEEMLGIDFVIPDVTYLLERKDKIRGLVLTHGHEDHIGGLPLILPDLDVPIYGTKLTLGMVEAKFRDSAPDYSLETNEVAAGESFTLGCFRLHCISVCHSIPDGIGLAIETPIGTIVHTGDFKLDPTPVDGRITDYSAFAEFGRRGVLLLLSDSTNVERNGFTPSERLLGGTLENLFRTYKSKRIIISAFASNLHRAQLIMDAAAKYNRKVVLMGRSMIQNVELARDLGYIKADDDLFLSFDEISHVPESKIVVLTTGSQGEPFSGLVLMSKGEHRHITLGPKDVVAVFATPIPGNEKLVSRTINRLFACGCEVIYDKDKNVHVSGHASLEELKMMFSMVRPKYFVPLHGEYRHLVRHGQLAREMGLPQRNIFVMQNGDMLRLTEKSAQVKRNAVPAGGRLVDGMALGEMQGSLLKERRDLSEDGILTFSVVLDRKWEVLGEPQVESVGFIHMKDAIGLRNELGKTVIEAVGKWRASKEKDVEHLKSLITNRVKDTLRRHGVKGRSYPVIIPMVTILEEDK
jgi:ribonuclease J